MTEPRRRRDPAGPARDYTTIGDVTAPAFARLPVATTIFAARSARLAALAEGNPLGPYLLFLSRLTAVQSSAPTRAARVQRYVDGVPPLSRQTLCDDDNFAMILQWLVDHALDRDAPEAAQQARRRLQALPWTERLPLAEAVFSAEYPADQLGECLYIAAALQVHLTRLAADLDAPRLSPAGNGVCPACGSGAVASLINADRARYCCCSLCATMWHHVRIKCTACGSTAGVSYFVIEDQSDDVAVETCSMCRSYIKHFHQHRRATIEPLADDVASFGLDMLVRQKGFRRTTINPLMVVA